MTTDIAVAAAEPATERKSTQAIWLEMQAAVRSWARQHADQVVAEHGNTRIHVDGSGDHDHDSGLVPLYTTVNGARKTVAMPEQGIDDFPSPYMRFHLGSYGKTVIFHICVDADKMTKEKTVNVASQGADTDPRLIVPLILSVIKKVIVPDLHQVHADTEVTAAAVSCLDMLTAVLDDGSKLQGRTVFGFEVETAEVLDIPDAFGLRLLGAYTTAFVRFNPDKSVTAQVFNGVRARSFSTKLKSMRLAAIVKALAFEDTDEVVTAAAEPELRGDALVDDWYDTLRDVAHRRKDAVVAEYGKFKVHLGGEVKRRGEGVYGVLYTTYDGRRVYTRWHGSEFSLPDLNFRLRNNALSIQTDISAFMQDLPERVAHTTMPVPPTRNLVPVLIAQLRRDVERLYKHVKIGDLVLMSDPAQATAAAEPPPQYTDPARLLAQLQHLRVRSKHFHLEFMKTTTAHVDDRGTVFVLGSVRQDAHADACFGPADYRSGFTVSLRDGAKSYVVKMPHNYPDPHAPRAVPQIVELATPDSDLRDIATALTKVFQTWFQKLDAEIDADEAVGAALATPTDTVTGEYFQAKPAPNLEMNPGTRERTRRYAISLKQDVLYKLLDDELKPIPGSPIEFVFFAGVSPGAVPGKVMVGFVAGPATHDGNLDYAAGNSRLRLKQPDTVVAVTDVKSYVYNTLRDYIYKLDDALRAVNS